VRLVQALPAVQHLALVANLAGGGRPTELDKGGVCLVAKVDQIRVDRANLYASPFARTHAPVENEAAVVCERLSLEVLG
jgi:hypothetical protein